MISDEIVQAAIISKLKSLTSLTARLGDGVLGIKEFSWQGDTFTYPAVRVDIEENEFYFDDQEKCLLQRVEFSVYIYTEDRSSKVCSEIKGLVANGLIGFTATANNIKFTPIRLVDNVPAIREDDRTWRSQIRLGSKVS